MNTLWSRLRSVAQWIRGVPSAPPIAPSNLQHMTTIAAPAEAEAEVAEFEVLSGRGQRFEPKLERELDTDLRVLARGLPGATEGLLGVVAFPGRRGVPDLLVLARGFASLRQRLANGAPYIESLADCTVVANLKVIAYRDCGLHAAVSLNCEDQSSSPIEVGPSGRSLPKTWDAGG